MRAFRYLWFLFCLTPVFGEEALPRVLIIGDAVYQQPASEVGKLLKGKVSVVYLKREPGEMCNTSTALQRLDEWIGEETWDLIHFNFGLGDLVYRAPGMKAFRVLPIDVGGVRTTAPEDYEKNLNELVKRLKATGATVVWGSTTPIRHSTTKVFEKGSEIEYNAIARRVMIDHKVIVNDMYAHVLKLIDMTTPAGHGADPFHFDRKPIHEPLVETILRELKLPGTN